MDGMLSSAGASTEQIPDRPTPCVCYGPSLVRGALFDASGGASGITTKKKVMRV